MQSLDKPVDRLPSGAGELVECEMTNLFGAADCQRLCEVVFRYMVDVSDHVYGHPASNSAHIARFELVILLLEVSHRLIGSYSSNADDPQHEEQEQAEQAQLDTFTRRNQLQVTLSLTLRQAVKRYIASCLL